MPMHLCRHVPVSRLVFNLHTGRGLGYVFDGMDLTLPIAPVDPATIESKAVTMIRLLLTALKCYESLD